MTEEVQKVIQPAAQGTRKSKRGKAKKKKTGQILGMVIKNMPGVLVQDPESKAGVSLQGIVLRATVVSRTKKGRYLLDVEGSVPATGGYVERSGMKLADRKGLSATTVRRLQKLTLNQASEFAV